MRPSNFALRLRAVFRRLFRRGATSAGRARIRSGLDQTAVRPNAEYRRLHRKATRSTPKIACNLRELLADCLRRRLFPPRRIRPVGERGRLTRRDIVAKSDEPGAPDKASFREMLRVFLLVSRFELLVHTEPRETPVYALVVAKGGPKLRARAPDSERYVLYRAAQRQAAITGTAVRTPPLPTSCPSSILHRPVIDKGFRSSHRKAYDLEFAYTPE